MLPCQLTEKKKNSKITSSRSIYFFNAMSASKAVFMAKTIKKLKYTKYDKNQKTIKHKLYFYISKITKIKDEIKGNKSLIEIFKTTQNY